MCNARLSMALWLVVFSAASTQAAFHLMKINEVLTGANGNTAIQYVELIMTASGQNFVSGHSLVSRDSTGNVIATFVIPANVTNGINTRRILFSTQAFADLGIVSPDFILPPNFLSPAGVQVEFTGSSFLSGKMSYAPYFGPGINGTPVASNANDDNPSLTRSSDTGNDNADFQNAFNTPTNNLNQTGFIPTNSAVWDWQFYQ